jgi:hypothetical protein
MSRSLREHLGIRASAIALATLFVVLLAPVSAVQAAEPRFGTPTIDGSLGEGIDLAQPVTLDEAPSRVELLVTYADSPSTLVIEVPVPTATGATTLRYSVDVAGDGHILPNTPVSARWRITPTDGPPLTGPAASMLYADEGHDWQTVSGDIVRVHWYEGSRAFGERALQIGQKAVRETADLLGVTETEPVDFFIYADLDAFYDALGPGTRENVGGQANADIRTLFALIEPREIDDPWVDSVVPHELVHLVFDTAVSNPYHQPPHWLNEGLAVYLSDGYAPSYRQAVEAAGRDGTLVPLDGLTGTFPSTEAGFFLGYAEAVSAVDFLVRTHDQDALVTLIGSYADGRTDDEAFEDAIGMDTAGFNEAWLADLGVETPQKHGPQPAPDGPLPEAWDGPGLPPGGGATQGPGAAPTDDGSGPGRTGDPGAPAAPTDGAGGSSSGGLVILGAVVALAVVLLVWSRSRRDTLARPRRGVPDDAST